jgi:hypothetical protein
VVGARVVVAARLGGEQIEKWLVAVVGARVVVAARLGGEQIEKCLVPVVGARSRVVASRRVVAVVVVRVVASLGVEPT